MTKRLDMEESSSKYRYNVFAFFHFHQAFLHNLLKELFKALKFLSQVKLVHV